MKDRGTGGLAGLLAVAVLAVPTAGAQPPTFPDLSKFVDIEQDNPIFTTARTGRMAVFRTPDGLICNADAQAQSCVSVNVGGMPGFPSNARHLDLSPCGPVAESVSSSDSGAEFVYTRDCDRGVPQAVLEPGRKVTVVSVADCVIGDYHMPNCTPGTRGAATCAVGAGRVTFCTNGRHGFVIQPSGSWTF